MNSSGPQLTTGIKGDWVGLYRRFFRSPNFSGWFHARYLELTNKLQAIQLQVLSQAVKYILISLFFIIIIFFNTIFFFHLQDLTEWVRDKQEVEVVDMILRIRQKLEQSNLDEIPLEYSVQEKLRERINDITQALPDDLQTILNKES